MPNKTRRLPTSHSPKKRRTYRKRRQRKSTLTWAERSFGHDYRRNVWLGGLLAAGFCLFLFYRYVVAPYNGIWQAIFGDVEYPVGYSIHGIDVSHHQGEIQWKKLAAAQIAGEPISFIVIKATEGKSLFDDNFNDNFYQAGQYGLIRGAYHFFSPAISGDIQARFFLKQVHLEYGDLPPVLDIEKNGTLSAEALRREALEWLQLVEKEYGVAPIIYTGLKFKQKFLNTPAFDRYPFWIAHYYTPKLGYTGTWKFWQHTDQGHLDGIKGEVDLNIYNGSMYDLRRLTIGHGKEPTEDETDLP